MFDFLFTGIHFPHLYPSKLSSTMSTLSSDLQENRQKNLFDHLESVKTEIPVTSEGEIASSFTLSDARNWPQWRKNLMIFMVSFHSMTSVFMAAGVVPAASTMAKAYGVSLADASYLVSAQVSLLSLQNSRVQTSFFNNIPDQIVLLGIAPIFWIVITETYGRHHVLIFSVLASMVCNIGGARCTTYAGQMITRVLTAIFISPPIGIGSGVVAGLSTPDEYARKVGWWVL
jgi:predicted MFS family arabinose efflux permease